MHSNKMGYVHPICLWLLSSLNLIYLSHKTADNKHSCALPSVESLATMRSLGHRLDTC